MTPQPSESKEEKIVKGAFTASLYRNNAQIKKDRALAIGKNAERIYRRAIEDREAEIEDIISERSNLLDLSASSTTTLIVASDFKAQEFVIKDLELGVKIRNLKVKLELAKARYAELFSDIPVSEPSIAAGESEV